MIAFAGTHQTLDIISLRGSGISLFSKQDEEWNREDDDDC